METVRKDGTQDKIEPDFLGEIESRTGVSVRLCFQCQKCFAGCPVGQFMDIPPNRINRMIQYGLKDRILESSTIWLCASCETCLARCPNEIDLPKLMDTLKQLAIKEKKRITQKKISAFHSIFLSNIKKSGKLHEMSLIRSLKMRTGGLFKDLGLGIKLFFKGKLSLSSTKIKGVDEIKKIFDASEGDM